MIEPAAPWNALEIAAALRAAPSAFAGRRIAVVGDAMLDLYRLADGTTRCYAGGAAVIAGHLHALGAWPTLITLIGRDGDSVRLVSLLKDANLDHRLIVERETLPVKVRRVRRRTGGQAICKLPGPELVEPVAEAAREQLSRATLGLEASLDAVIFADFGYGTVTADLLEAVLPLLRPRARVLAGDVSGARASLLGMREFDLLTPTEHELRWLSPSVARRPPLDVPAWRLLRELGLGHLLVTRAEAGCVRFDANGGVERLDSVAHDVVDEVGAGDAMLAVTTLAMASGMSISIANRLGCVAAAAAVGQLGNDPVTFGRLAAVASPPRRATSTTSAA